MLNAINNFFASPEDKDPSFIRVTRNILILALVATAATIAIVFVTRNAREMAVTLSALGFVLIFEFVAFLLVLRGILTVAKALLPITFLFAITFVAANANTIHDISVVAFPAIIMMAAFLQGRRLLAITTVLAVAAIIFLGVLDMTGVSDSPIKDRTGIDDILIGSIEMVVSAGLLNLLVSRLKSALAKAESNELAQIQANEELKKLQAVLEQRVQERTTELTQRGHELESANREVQRRALQFETVAQVSQTITSIRDLQELLPHIASVISEKFGFYHVGVFLLDDAREYAVLSATNSSGGKQMMQRRHRLRIGEQGIVGYVTATGTPRIAMDVGKDAVFFDNPELPDTHSEMALPLTSGGRIVGALDVQSTERGAFREEDVQTLSLMANQVSLAIENARLFDETRRALSESEAVSRQTTREAWSKLPAEQSVLGYRYTQAGAAPLNNPVDFDERAEVRNNGKASALNRVVVPIELRGETIGTLVVQTPSGNALNDDQMDLIRAAAERVAISAENARLFDETTRRAERERLVSDITGKIRSVNDPQTMIQTAMEELRKALGASRVDVLPQSVKDADQGR